MAGSSVRLRNRLVRAISCPVWRTLVLLFACAFPPTAAQNGSAPGSPGPRADLGPARELVRLQKYEEADRLLADLQNTHPDDPSLLLLRGEVLLAVSNPEKAAELFRRAAEVSPQKLRVHFGLGTALSAVDDESGALAAFGKEIELNPDPEIRAKARVNRSVLYERAQKWNEAAAELEALLAEAPERQEAYGDLAQLYLKAGRTDEALRAVEQGAERGLLAAPLYLNVGADYFNRKAFDRAAASFSRALEIQPDLALAELNLALALDRLDRKDEANSHLERYLELRPDAPEASEIQKRLAGPPKKTASKAK